MRKNVDGNHKDREVGGPAGGWSENVMVLGLDALVSNLASQSSGLKFVRTISHEHGQRSA